MPARHSPRELALRVLAFTLLFFPPGSAEAKTLYVSKSGDNTTGASWATAFTSINQGISDATHGDVILCASGEYKENLVIEKQIEIRGGYQLSSNSRSSSQAYSVIRPNRQGIIVEVIVNCRLRGLTIRGGIGNLGRGLHLHGDIGNCPILHVEDCIIEDNMSGFSGGGAFLALGEATFKRCVFRGNRALAYGGGLHATECRIHLEDCLFSENFCPPFYNGLPSQAGGLSISNSDVQVKNCQIFKNSSSVNSEVAIFSWHPEHVLVQITNSTIVSPAYEPVVVDLVTGEAQVRNCIMIGNELGLATTEVTVANSNITGWVGGPGNIDADPLFVDPENGDFRLQSNSPCIDSGTTVDLTTDFDGNPRPIDVLEVGRDGTGDEFDMGAFEYIPPTPTPEPTFVNPRSDIDQSGEVDSLDLLIFLADWKKTTTSKSTAKVLEWVMEKWG
jgi:hypothetical protein